MEDNSSASSDSDNALLSPNNKPHIGRNAATQTPEMPRHEINTQKKASMSDASSGDGAYFTQNGVLPFPTPPDSSILVYKLDTHKPMSELEQDAKNLSIPDVVVEYIREGMTGTNSPHSFETQELIVVRTPSAISLRDEVAQSETQIGKEDGLGFLSVMDPSLRASSTSLRCPSPSFGYRPLESETSHVYTIISPVKYKGTSEKELELRLMEQLQDKMEKEKTLVRKFEYNPAPAEVERRRRRLQCATDVCSTLFLLPGILIAVVTPVLLIPMFLLPLKYYLSLIALFIVTGSSSVVCLAISGLIGNVVWHYDNHKNRLRPRLHCGTGPLRHFWGNGYYPEDSDRLNKEKV